MLKTFTRSFLPAAWLGWQIESNWTDPFLFVAFSIVKPVASVMILVFMYQAVAARSASPELYAYIYLGNAFYIYVGAVMSGGSYSVLDDRERYRTLKYIYISPVSLPVYLFGRAVARFITGSLAVAITLFAGAVFFHVPINIEQTDWPLFLAAMVLGIICLCFMGIALGAWTLTLRTEPWFAGDAVAAALYLFSGAVFPLTILPAWIRPVGYLLPVTYWLELIRRSLLGSAAAGFPTLAGWSNLQLFAVLLTMTVVFGLAAFGLYRYFDWRAREAGMIDASSNY